MRISPPQTPPRIAPTGVSLIAPVIGPAMWKGPVPWITMESVTPLLLVPVLMAHSGPVSNHTLPRLSNITGADEGVAGTEGGREIGYESDSSFRYTVTRAKSRILIYGGSEDGVMIFSIVDGSRSFFGVRARMELLEDVTIALLEAGMKEITNEELEELDAQRRKKEAEQVETRNPYQPPC